MPSQPAGAAAVAMLLEANPQVVGKTVPDGTLLPVESGGAEVFPVGGQAPSSRQDAPAADPNLAAQLLALLQPKDKPQELGAQIPMIDGQGDGVAHDAASKPEAPTQSQPEALAPTPQATPEAQPDPLSLANQLAQAQFALLQAQQRAEQAESRSQQFEARVAHVEPLLAAVQQKWPEIQGIEQKLRESEGKIAYKDAREAFAMQAIQSGVAPDFVAFDTAYQQKVALERVANIDKVIEEKLHNLFGSRDTAYQQQVQQQQSVQREQQMQQHFLAEWAKVEAAVPALRDPKNPNDTSIRDFAWTRWAMDPRQPVTAAVDPIISRLRQQAVAAQAPQITRAEQQAAFPRTAGSSGAAALPQAEQRPANWKQMGTAARREYMRSQGR